MAFCNEGLLALQKNGIMAFIAKNVWPLKQGTPGLLQLRTYGLHVQMLLLIIDDVSLSISTHIFHDQVKSQYIFYVHHLTTTGYRVAKNCRDRGQNPNDVHAKGIVNQKSHEECLCSLVDWSVECMLSSPKWSNHSRLRIGNYIFMTDKRSLHINV